MSQKTMRSAAVAFVLAMTAVAGAGITGAATPVSPATVRDGAVAWLAPQVTAEGALISSYTSAPDPSLTAQAALAFAGSGVEEATLARMIDYLEVHVDDFVAPGGSADSPGALGWLILDAVATDTDPYAFGGVDLVARLQATQQGDGRFGSGDPTYDGSFRQGLSLLALSAVGIDDSAGLAWLRAQQCADGGFVAYRADPTVPCPAVDPATFTGADTNSTAMAAMALHVAGDTAGATAAMAWLEGVRTAAGGFAYLGDASLQQDANSTGLVAMAFRTVRGVTDAGSVDALSSLQVPASGVASDRGGIAFQTGDPLFPDLMASTQAILGLVDQPLPFAPVPFTEPVEASTTTSTSTSMPVDVNRDSDPLAATPVVTTPTYTG